MVAMLVFILIAAPAVFYLWGVLDQVLEGHFSRYSDLAAVAVLAALAAWVVLFGKVIGKNML
jgi:hypothetical protein